MLWFWVLFACVLMALMAREILIRHGDGGQPRRHRRMRDR